MPLNILTGNGTVLKLTDVKAATRSLRNFRSKQAASPLSWPAAMRLGMAADYCGMSVDTFKKVCPVKPIQFTDSTRGDRFSRVAIDEWLASLDPNVIRSPTVRRFGEKLHGGQGANGRS